MHVIRQGGVGGEASKYRFKGRRFTARLLIFRYYALGKNSKIDTSYLHDCKRCPYRHRLCPYKACNGVEVARKWSDDPLSREGGESFASVSEEVSQKIEVVF